MPRHIINTQKKFKNNEEFWGKDFSDEYIIKLRKHVKKLEDNIINEGRKINPNKDEDNKNTK